jgi:O-antigen/teichoic acid export membrane protein
MATACQLLRFLVLFCLLFGVSTRVLWVIVASVASELVNLAISTPISIRLLPAQRFRWKAIRWPLAREITSYGGWTLVNQIAQTAKLAMDPIVLNRFASAVDVAIFNVAGLVPRQIPMLVTPISRPFIPIFAMMHATGDAARLRSTYLRTARYNTWLVLTISIPAMIFSNDLIRLYLGGRYPGAGVVMTVLLFMPILTALNALGLCAIAAAGDMKGLALRQVAVHSANLGLTILFVVFLGKGAFGSAAATLVATLVLDTTLTWRLSWKVTHTPAKAWLLEVLLPTMTPALPAVIVCLSWKWAFGIASWTGLFAASAASAALYVVLVAAFGLRDQDRIDIGRVADRLPRPARGFVHRLSRLRSSRP